MVLRNRSAYETLKDEDERRKYDRIYPSLKKKTTSQNSAPKSTPKPHPQADPKPKPTTPSETAQIAALQKSIQERTTRWQTTNKCFESSIFEIKRDVRRLENEITALDSITAAENAEEAQKNSWKTWFLSPISKEVEDTQEMKEQKDRARQERRIQKDVKDRRLLAAKARLASQEEELRVQMAKFEVANIKDQEIIGQLQDKIRQREERKRREKEEAERAQRARQEQKRAEAERAQRAREREQWEKRQREAAEERKQREAKLAAEQQRRMEQYRRQAEEELLTQRGRQRQAEQALKRQREKQASCRHDGWWPKVEGRTECPRCDETWTYLLKCPSCQRKLVQSVRRFYGLRGVGMGEGISGSGYRVQSLIMMSITTRILGMMWVV